MYRYRKCLCESVHVCVCSGVWISVFLCVCACVCIHFCLCFCIITCYMHVEARRQSWLWFLKGHSPWFWRQDLSLACSSPNAISWLGLQAGATKPIFLNGCWGSNSNPLICNLLSHILGTCAIFSLLKIHLFCVHVYAPCKCLTPKKARKGP